MFERATKAVGMGGPDPLSAYMKGTHVGKLFRQETDEKPPMGKFWERGGREPDLRRLVKETGCVLYQDYKCSIEWR